MMVKMGGKRMVEIVYFVDALSVLLFMMLDAFKVEGFRSIHIKTDVTF